MNMDSLNKWLTLAANIGVIAGIVFLGIEVNQQSDSINQSNRIANAQFLANDQMLRITAYDLKVGDDLPASLSRAIFNSPDITNRDLVVIDAYLSREWMRVLQNRNMVLEGFSQTAPVSFISEWVFQHLTNDITLKWWKNNQEGMLAINTETRDEINSILASLGDEHTLYSMELNLERLKE